MRKANLILLFCQVLFAFIHLKVEATTGEDDLGCTLYLAPSIIPGGGLGMFTTIEYEEDEEMHNLPADISIPYGLPDDDDSIMGGMTNYHWESKIVGDTEHHLVQYHEGSTFYDMVPGFGAIANSDHHYENIQHADSNRAEPAIDQWDRPHPGTDAYTPFHHAHIKSLQYIAQGAELFVSYGDNYFKGRKYFPYNSVPLTEDYEQAEEIMSRFINNPFFHDFEEKMTIPSTRKKVEYSLPMVMNMQGLWDQVRDNVSLRVQTALPKDVNIVLDSMGTEFSLGVNKRPVEWIRSEGMCLDRLEIRASEILEAGRGAFAKHYMPKGTMLVPVPVIQVNRTLQAIVHHNDPEYLSDHHTKGASERLMVNYCFSHANSTLMLCPYVSTVAVINHSPQPNAKLVLSTTKHFNRAVLDKSPQELMEHGSSLGVVFEIVATQDIAAGEEIYLDYGPDWQDAWDAHIEEWKPFLLNIDNKTTLDPLMDCVVEYDEDDEDEDMFTLYNVPECLKERIQQVSQQTPFERHNHKVQTACFYFPHWNHVLTHEEALKGEIDPSENMQIFPWRFAVHYENFPKPTGAVGGLYPCHILASQDSSERYTALVLLDYDENSGLDYDDLSEEENIERHDDGRFVTSRTTRRQIQLVKDFPLKAIRRMTQAWRDECSVDHNRYTDFGTPLPFRHYIDAGDAFPSSWKDLL